MAFEEATDNDRSFLENENELLFDDDDMSREEFDDSSTIFEIGKLPPKRKHDGYENSAEPLSKRSKVSFPSSDSRRENRFEDVEKVKSVVSTTTNNNSNNNKHTSPSTIVALNDDTPSNLSLSRFADIKAVVSSRYDTCIVYALDASLTRGAYHIFAKWFYDYTNKENLPGSLVIVGFSTAGNTCSKSKNVDLGGSFPVPYVSLNPNDAYAIFDFKRQTGYPAIVLLITLPASPIETCLSCDGAILFQARHTMRRNMTEIAEVLQQLNRSYLADLYDSVNAFDQCETREEEEDKSATADENCDVSKVAFEKRYEDAGSAIEFAKRSAEANKDNTQHVISNDDFFSPREYHEDEDADRVTFIAIPNLPRMVMSHVDDRYDSPSTNDDDRYAMSTRLRNQNNDIIQELRKMDLSLTETHSADYVPVIHGDSLDVDIYR